MTFTDDAEEHPIRWEKMLCRMFVCRSYMLVDSGRSVFVCVVYSVFVVHVFESFLGQNS